MHLPALLVMAIILSPLLAATGIGVGIVSGRVQGEAWERRTSLTALAAATLSLLAALLLLIHIAVNGWPAADTSINMGSWLHSGDYRVDLIFLPDALGAVGALLVTGICWLITKFSVDYLHREPGFHRFFALLGLFAFATLLLVLAGDAVLSFCGWELTGLCCYLLIGFFYDRDTAADNATNAFVTNRVGDAGFLLGFLTAYHWSGTTQWSGINAAAAEMDSLHVVVIASGFTLAAMTKSAQVPLASWLARAVDGPTPSSALCCGALMLHAGVYLLLRCQGLMAASSALMLGLAFVGAVTAFYGFFSGLAQSDIQSALVCSATAQVGLMIVECGLGFWTLASVHVCAHAVLRGYQFLTAPSVLQQLEGLRLPAPALVQESRAAYAAALQRFWLEDLICCLVINPVRRLAKDLNSFDAAVVDRAFGLPASPIQAVLSPGQRRPTGAVANCTEVRLLTRVIGRGLVRLGRSAGHTLNQVEHVIARPRLVFVLIVAMLLALM